MPQQTVAAAHLEGELIMRKTLSERFWAKVDKSTDLDGCWLWRGSTDTQGYGQIAINGKGHRAHRVAYEMIVGVIPIGICCLHHCDVRQCVRPDHLFLGTKSDNMQDAVAKGRIAVGARNGAYTHPERVLRGEQHGRVILTESSVRSIRFAYAIGGVTQRALAKMYNVGKSTINEILSRRIWKHVA